MGSYLQANQQLWDEWTLLHEQAPAYKVEEFKSGASTLRPIERDELRDVAGKTVAHFLAPGGLFYIVEFHPFSRVFDADAAELTVASPYFFSEQPFRFEMQGSYAAEAAAPLHGYNWNHSLGEVFNALLGAGLRIE